MYCYHCAKHINEAKVDAKPRPFDPNAPEIPADAKIAYVCPRCGHLITRDATQEDIKSLSRASHAQLQRARNSIAIGMGFNSIGVIAVIIAVLFFFLAKKPSNQYRLVVDCAEFYVSVALFAVAVVFLGIGLWRLFSGLVEKRANEGLLKEINNRTFVQ